MTVDPALDPIVLDKHVDHDGLGVAVVATAFEPNEAGCSVCLSTVDVFADTRGGPAVSLTARQARAMARWLDKVADAWGDRSDAGRGGVVVLLVVVVLVLAVAGGVGGLLAAATSQLGPLAPQCVVPTAAGCDAGPGGRP